jgi:hypothetical protein
VHSAPKNSIFKSGYVIVKSVPYWRVIVKWLSVTENDFNIGVYKSPNVKSQSFNY